LALVQARFESSGKEIPFDFAQGKLSLHPKNGCAQDDAGQFAGEGFQSAAAAGIRDRFICSGNPFCGEAYRKMKQGVQIRGLRWQPVLRTPAGDRIPMAPATRGRLRVAAPHRTGMDITWLTDRIAVGGGIWTADNMTKVAREGVTHIIDMQIEFDDTPLAAEHGIEVLWNPTDDDFEPKPAALFQRGVQFALAAIDQTGTKLFIHCAAGVHRAPMMALALLGSMGWKLEDAMDLIESRRFAADFADVYVKSVEAFLDGRAG
jgi:hypothetical protein